MPKERGGGGWTNEETIRVAIRPLLKLFSANKMIWQFFALFELMVKKIVHSYTRNIL